MSRFTAEALIGVVDALSKDADLQFRELSNLGFSSGIVLGVDELALQFYDQAILADQLYVLGQITEEQVFIVKKIDKLLEQMSGAKNAEFWTEDSLSASPLWNSVRLLAREFHSTFENNDS